MKPRNLGDWWAAFQGWAIAAAFVATLTLIALTLAEGNRVDHRPPECFERSADGNYIRQYDEVCR